MTHADQLLTQALQLPLKDRASLAHKLLLSLDPGEEALTDSEWEAAWVAEAEARSTAYERGETTADDWRQALDRIRQNLKSSQPS